MTERPFHISTQLDPSRDEVARHSIQVWLHAARQIGTEAVGKPRQVSFTVKDTSGEIVGGVLAKLQMRVLYIDGLWVNPDFQRRGVGSALREQVFTFARDNNCVCIIGTTYEFYDAIGFLTKDDPEVEILGKIENCPAPYSLVFVIRKL